MRLTILTAVLLIAACGSEERTSEESKNPQGEYATGALPTADTVQRESEVHVARSGEQEDEEEKSEQR